MSRYVVATAGHVDHGKSTLVRALTGIETDRWAEEKRRGLTIDLGFAWMRLPGGDDLAFVDVPGHERFLGNMLAGLGPAPVVLLVVAADEGWRAQSSDHRDALAALGIEHGLVALTRADRASAVQIARAREQVRTELRGTGLRDAPILEVSARTGEGLPALVAALEDVLASTPAPRPAAPLRMWIDRSFTISGAGTVVTGTLAEGTLRTGELLELHHEGRSLRVTVRGLQSENQGEDLAEPVSRTAVNLRGVAADRTGRGDVLITPGAWHLTSVIDVRRRSGAPLDEAPRQVLVHGGTASLMAQVRPLGPDHARLSLPHALPLALGDSLVLRGTGERAVLGGVQVLDVDPPALTRRGDGKRRAAQLAQLGTTGDVRAEVSRRGAVREDAVRRMGVQVPDPLPASVHRESTWLVDAVALERWAQRLREAVGAHAAADELSAGLPRKAAVDLLDLPDPVLLAPVVRAAGLTEHDGRLRSPSAAPAGLGAAEAAVAALESRLGGDPFTAPEADELAALALGPRELAAAERQGRVLRLPGEVVLLPTAPALAMRELARLDQPFTLSQARQALGTTRRVAVPLLEHLDARGWTRRVDGQRREVVRGGR